MKTILLIFALLAVVACSDPKPAEPSTPTKIEQQTEIVPLPNQNAARCNRLMSELRAMRGGPQPCESSDDCTVFHNGEYWDGCPVEVNKANAETLDRMRVEIDGQKCPVEKGAACAPAGINGCVGGNCGAALLIAPEKGQ
ncbi:MAG: hypothetical protein JRF63_15195 [Deltaproteobacteria bacterium]|nr:hypothetical protein [Deltaproteobacteria bacterium]